MATNSTDYTWYWYVRKKGKNWVLGLVDKNGDSPTGVLNIEYWYDEIPDEITQDLDSIPIPVEFEHGFAMGVVYEILRMNNVKFTNFRRDKLNKLVPDFLADFNDAIYDAIEKQIQETQQPLTISPYDLRMDESTISTISPNL